MGIYWLSFVSVILFCLSSRFLVKEIVTNTYFIRTEDYSVKALRMQRAYKIFAWALLTIFLFYSFLISFVESFSEALHTVG